MRKVLFTIVLLSGASFAQEPAPTPVITPDTRAVVKAADLPEMNGVPEFAERSNFMSLAGSLRYRAYEHSGEWLTREQSVAALNEQVESSVEAASR
ncbi:MAG: hypothetical protein J0I12_08115 [Candidatus Eremiobacteraeota bacterium]|nr:hypothetical protein [Candidatus Eremiobacteraeota bacterium]